MKKLLILSFTSILILGCILFYFNSYPYNTSKSISDSGLQLDKAKAHLDTVKYSDNVNEVDKNSDDKNSDDKNTINTIKNTLDDDDYIVIIAKKAIGNSLMIPRDCVVKISRIDKSITVRFLHPIQKNTRGPDFYAEVKIDYNTGEIIRVLSGS
jgi:ABC-type uncharacterized transport system substrate-binding protein